MTLGGLLDGAGLIVVVSLVFVCYGLMVVPIWILLAIAWGWFRILVLGHPRDTHQ